jgi:hypothetical protein
VLEIKKERKKKMMDPAGIFCEDRIMEHLLCMGKKMRDSLRAKRQGQRIARRGKRQSSVRVAYLTISVKIKTPA